MPRQLSLADFDDKPMDGLQFARKVFRLFDQIKKSPNGISRLRRTSDRTAKKLMEELVPIAVFIQRRYTLGLRLKVRWLLGNQRHDATLECSGPYTDLGMSPKMIYLEVTSVRNDKEYLHRELLDSGGVSFGLGTEGVKRTV
jgi:hypothetical protein